MRTTYFHWETPWDTPEPVNLSHLHCGLQCFRNSDEGHPHWPKNALNIHNLSDLSEIDEDIVRGEDGDGAGDDVEHGLYLEQDINVSSKLSLIR